MNGKISYSNAHPNAQRLMEDDLFYDVTDQFAPFGDDDSWETFRAFQEWLQNNVHRNRLDFIEDQLSYFGYPRFDLHKTDFAVIKEYLQRGDLHGRYFYGTDEVIIAAAFAQLYLEGRIDLNLRQLAVTAIKRQTLPELMATQSEEFKATSLPKYDKLLSVLLPK